MLSLFKTAIHLLHLSGKFADVFRLFARSWTKLCRFMSRSLNPRVRLAELNAEYVPGSRATATSDQADIGFVHQLNFDPTSHGDPTLHPQAETGAREVFGQGLASLRLSGFG
jgi:hypothetical protein